MIPLRGVLITIPILATKVISGVRPRASIQPLFDPLVIGHSRRPLGFIDTLLAS